MKDDNELLEFPKCRIKLDNIADAHPKCKRRDGKLCSANVDGKCIALSSASFGGKPCPFFRDYREMSVKEAAEYKRNFRRMREYANGNT